MSRLLTVLPLIDLFALLFFFCCWSAYAVFTHRAGSPYATLARALHGVRWNWIRELLQRDMRIADITAIGGLQRNVTFVRGHWFPCSGCWKNPAKLSARRPLQARNSCSSR